MRKQKYFIILFLFIILTVTPLISQKAFYEEAKKHAVQIAPIEAKKMMENFKILLFDVRSEKEYKSGTIKNSINIPWRKIDSKISEFTKDKCQTILIFCYSGARGTMATYKLIKAGYKNVFNIEGGITAWKNSKLPTIMPE